MAPNAGEQNQDFEHRRRLLPVLQISASQLESFSGAPESCHRRWAFESVFKLPKVEKGSQNFGTVLHGCLERYLDSDSNGYALDANGKATDKAVNLFPDGWEGGLEEAEQELVKQLITLGIEAGLLERYPGRQVEYGFLGQVTEHTKIKGFIDLLCVDQGIVADHKSTSNFKYAKSAEKLRSTTQMLIYAKVLLEMAKDKGIEHKTVTLRHNQFLKDLVEPKAKRTECVVSVQEIEDKWEWVKQKAEEMRLWRDKIWLSGAYGEDKVKEAGTERIPGQAPVKWSDIPGAPSISACHAYGGCAFLNICGKIESIDGYRNRVQKYLDRIEETRKKESEEIAMGVISRATKGAAPAPVTTPAPIAAPTPVVNPTPTPTPAPVAAPAASNKIVIKKSVVITTAPKPAAPVTTDPPPTLSGFVELTPENPLVVNGAKVPTEKKSLDGLVIPPWAHAECGACDGAGMGSTGFPCNTCNGHQSSIGGEVSDNYTWKTDANKKLVSFAKKVAAIAAEVDLCEVETIASTEDLSAIGDEGVDTDTDGGEAQNTSQETKTQETNPDGTPKKRGRPKGSKNRPKSEGSAPAPATKAPAPVSAPVSQPVSTPAVVVTQTTTYPFDLCIDCRPVSSVVPITSGMAIFEKAAGELAAEMQVASYWELNAFSRRDQMASRAKQIAETLSGIVVFTTMGVDSKEFANQLSSFARVTTYGA